MVNPDPEFLHYTKIIDPATGHEWRVYPDGKLVGFPEGVIMINGLLSWGLTVEGNAFIEGREYERKRSLEDARGEE